MTLTLVLLQLFENDDNVSSLCVYYTRFSIQLSYKDSGVDIEAGDDLVQKIKPMAKKTHRPGVIGGLGGFGGLLQLNKVTPSL